MKRVILEFLFILIVTGFSVFYFYKEDYWFALILIIPVFAMVIVWAKRDETSHKIPNEK